MDSKALARSNLDRRLTALRTSDVLARPPRGWVRAIRDALGMTTRQMAERLGVSQPRIVALEKDELRDSITLGRLRKAAEALDCTLGYVLIPNRPLQETLEAKAGQVADRQLARTHHTMGLENQALGKEALAAERERLIDALLRSDPKRLWDTP
ncbi:mobile mystery protein A [Caulobacter sp. DWR1-3-2b1]|uniref:mobile mystery protein A n=1 Tax=Caulobacter sp. DWR1-3-2b1 TaxID=2804670 RepID=UPI003CE793D4